MKQVAALSWRPSAVVTICWYTGWADPSFLVLSHWWLKPSGKLDILTLFTYIYEPWTIHGMFCFSAPQFTSEQSLFAFQTYLQIFHGRQIHVHCLGRQFLDSFVKTAEITPQTRPGPASMIIGVCLPPLLAEEKSLLRYWQFLSYIITQHLCNEHVFSLHWPRDRLQL